MTNDRRVVFMFFEPDAGEATASVKAKKFDDLLEKYGPLPRPTPGATAEQVLAGLHAWVKQWAAWPSNDEARLILMYDNGYRDDRAGMFTAQCDAIAFQAVLLMAMPPEWQHDA